jgi:hypothetical protein
MCTRKNDRADDFEQSSDTNVNSCVVPFSQLILLGVVTFNL